MITSTDILFTKHRLQDIVSYLQQSDVQSIAELKDDKGNSLLHHWCYRNRLNIIQALIKYEQQYISGQRDAKSPEQHISAWVNGKNTEGFTPAHYASNVGNIEMMKYLKGKGANLRACSNNDLNLMHLAAQGDKLNSMIELSDIIEMDSKDDQGWTSLHWASQMGSQNIVQFLLSNDISYNQKNNDGETPLYVACKEGQTKIVRKLLIKGANRQIANNQGKKPIDIASQYQFHIIKRMLNNNYGLLDYVKFYLNTQVRYEPVERSICMPILFILSALFIIVTAHMLVRAPFLVQNNLYIIIPSCFYGLFFIIYLSLLKSPKPLGQPSSYKYLIDKLPICTQCRIPKVQRSYHCPICKTCIEQYDHHCPWINSCVGKRNVVRFVIFLLLLCIAIIECCILSVFGIFIQGWSSPFQLFSEGSWKTVRLVILIIDIVITFVFTFPLLYLVIIQTTNLFLNKTTFQRFTKTGKKPIKLSTLGSSQHSVLSTFHQPDYCSFGNCMIMCSNQQKAYQYRKLKESEYNIDD